MGLNLIIYRIKYRSKIYYIDFIKRKTTTILSSGLSFNKNISTGIELSIENKGKKYEDYCRNLYFNGKYSIVEYFNCSLYWV